MDGNKYEILFNASLHLEKLKVLVEAVDSFNGRTAKTDRAVMRALVQIAELHGAYTIRPGVRKISEYCGHDARTVCRALRRLERKAWITYTWEADPRLGMSSRIRLHWELAVGLVVVSAEPDSSILRDISIWTGDGLGSNARAIYKTLLLAESPIKKRQIQDLTRLGYKAVTSALDLLLGENLVIRDGRKYQVSYLNALEENRLLNDIRVKFGVEQKQNYRLDRHFYQRNAFNLHRQVSFHFRMISELAFKEERKRKELRLKLSQNDAVTK